jgi:2-dehydro-3-deoxyphosphogluconate aldolase/(4S)-4-hydroxy-2-oxoglutarate aldolase
VYQADALLIVCKTYYKRRKDMTVNETIQKCGILPVISINDAAKAVDLSNALLAGGINVAEVTFRTDAAAESIRNISDHCPEMLVCAGTVLNVDQAEEAFNCGAKAIISPGLNEEVVKWCLEMDLPVYPGVATPTEVEAGIHLGLNILKLFPAEVIGGVKMVKALGGPYKGIKFIPTGGVMSSNLGHYLSLKNVLACGGSWICTPELIDSSNWSEITRLSKEAEDIVSSADR